jgi:Rieske Fe-S protein
MMRTSERAAGAAAQVGEGASLAVRICPGIECDVSRRQFIGATLAAAAALLSACGDGQIGAGGNPLAPGVPGEGTVIRLADYPALAQVGGIVRVDTTAGAVAIAHVGDNAYAAYSMRCPHQGTTVRISGSGFICPNHQARFDAQGRWIGGQRTSGLFTIPATYAAADGTLTLGVTTAPGAGAGGGSGDDDDEEEDDD